MTSPEGLQARAEQKARELGWEILSCSLCLQFARQRLCGDHAKKLAEAFVALAEDEADRVRREEREIAAKDQALIHEGYRLIAEGARKLEGEACAELHKRVDPACLVYRSRSTSAPAAPKEPEKERLFKLGQRLATQAADAVEAKRPERCNLVSDETNDCCGTFKRCRGPAGHEGMHFNGGVYWRAAPVPSSPPCPLCGKSYVGFGHTCAPQQETTPRLPAGIRCGNCGAAWVFEPARVEPERGEP